MMRTVSIPVSPDCWVALQVPANGLTEKEWVAMLSVLVAMKASLVVRHTPTHQRV